MRSCSNSRGAEAETTYSFMIWRAGAEGSLRRGRIIACVNANFVTCIHFKLQRHFSSLQIAQACL